MTCADQAPHSRSGARALVPGALSAAGGRLWVGDLTRPVVATVHGRPGPGPAQVWRWQHDEHAGSPAITSLCALPAGGCLAAGSGGTVYLHTDGAVTRLTDRPTGRLVSGLDDPTGPEAVATGSGGRWQAAAVSPPGIGMEPAVLYLLGSGPAITSTPDSSSVDHGGNGGDGALRVVDVLPLPGPLVDLVASSNGFLALLRVERDDPDDYGHRADHRLLRVLPGRTATTVGTELGPPLDTGGLHRPLHLLTSVWAHDTTGGVPRFAAVTPELTLRPGPPAPAVTAVRGMRPFWDDGHRLYAAIPTAVPGPSSAVCTLSELDPTTLAVTGRLDLPWVPSDVAPTTAGAGGAGDADDVGGAVWISGHDTTDPRRPRRPLLRWVPPDGHDAPQGAPVDLTAPLTEHLQIPLAAPPATGADLDDWMYDRAFAIAEAIGHGGGTIDPIGFHVEGHFPDAHAVVVFTPQADPDLRAALARPLFTLDGVPRPLPGDRADIAVHEKMNTGGLDDLRAQTPDAAGLVWLTPPRQPLGALD